MASNDKSNVSIYGCYYLVVFFRGSAFLKIWTRSRKEKCVKDLDDRSPFSSYYIDPKTFRAVMEERTFKGDDGSFRS